MNNKLRKYMASIIDPTPEVQMSKRLLFATYHTKRVQFLNSLKMQVGLHGKEYSEAVVKYDSKFNGVSLFG